MQINLLFAFLLFTVAGCSSGTMVVNRYDGVTGESSHTIYTKYYDDGVWLVPKSLGMSVVVDHEKTNIPVVTGVQQSLGALGPGDSYANGKITIYLWNFDSQKRPVNILRVESRGQSLALGGKVIEALPSQRSGGHVGDMQISNYGTEIPITVFYELNGRQASAKLKLQRRTHKQLEEYFGEKGTPPYPWFQGAR